MFLKRKMTRKVRINKITVKRSNEHLAQHLSEAFRPQVLLRSLMLPPVQLVGP